MRVACCGVRGSTPAPGIEFAQVGGNTSCLAVGEDGGAHPRLLLDAGTGIRRVSSLLGGDPFAGTIMLTHLHWDHVQGLPFFAAADRPDATVRLLVPESGGSALELLARALSPPHFPIGPDGLRGAWSFESIDEGRHVIEGFDVLARAIPHKGGVTFGYRISDGSSTFAYLPDHRPAAAGTPERAAAVELADGVDVLVHDAQFTAGEAVVADAYGHATIDQAVSLAAESLAKRLVLFHHSPARTDGQVDEMAAAVQASMPVHVAREGELLPL